MKRYHERYKTVAGLSVSLGGGYDGKVIALGKAEGDSFNQMPHTSLTRKEAQELAEDLLAATAKAKEYEDSCNCGADDSRVKTISHHQDCPAHP